MVEFRRIYGVLASLSRALLARISRSNKLPLVADVGISSVAAWCPRSYTFEAP
jgi:hypothetical protein